MNSAASEHSTSGSSSSEDDESDSCGSDSTATCNPVQDVGDPLSFNGIGTINMDNCQESHIGPRIITDNLNIILSHPKEFQYLYGNRDWEKEIGSNAKVKNKVTEENCDNPSFSWNYKRAPFSYISKIQPRKLLLILSGFLILVAIVVVFGFLFGRKSRNDGGRSTTVAITTLGTITTLGPVTSPVTWPVTSPITWPVTRPVTEPTDDGHTVPTTPAPAFGKFIDRKSWNGMSPPPDSLRGLQLAWNLALDNLPGDRCSTVDVCSTILQQHEKAENGSLNYNFLIDDSGNVYEARGWDYKSDDQFPNANASTTVKAAFIGSYSDSHLTKTQISSFQTYIQGDSAHVLSVVHLEAQCCRDLPSETGPDKNVICGMNAIGYVKARGCSNCRWPRDQLNCQENTNSKR